MTIGMPSLQLKSVYSVKCYLLEYSYKKMFSYDDETSKDFNYFPDTSCTH